MDSYENVCIDIRKRVSPADFKQFSSMSCKSQRFNFVQQLDGIRQIDLFAQRDFGKNLDLSAKYKSGGNEAFRDRRWNDALLCYNCALLAIPCENETERAVVLANRSAVLLHMDHVEKAVTDVNRALPHYPAENAYKLYERRAKCLWLLGRPKEALKDYLRASYHVNFCKLREANKMVVLGGISAMVKFLQRNSMLEEGEGGRTMNGTNGVGRSEEFLSDLVKIDYTELEGRFARCTQTTQAGELILKETPHCAVLLEKYHVTHCQTCFERCLNPLPCDRCADVIFCSEKCRRKAFFHQWECGMLKTLWKSKASITCQLALRIITIEPIEYYLYLQPLLEEPDFDPKETCLNDYRNVYTLLTHECRRTGEDLFQRTLMAYFLLTCLRKTGYLDGFWDFDSYIGNLLLHNLQVLQYNAHEIFELQKHSETDIGTTTFFGGGIFPKLALFNHSCDPGTVRYFKGTQVHVHLMKNLNAGDLIEENYGPIFTQNPLEERQLQLERQYKFVCQCQACREDWPLYKDMDLGSMKFRCKQREACGAVLPFFDVNTLTEAAVKCSRCGKPTNIIERLKIVKNVDKLLNEAQEHFMKGKQEKALRAYLDILVRMDSALAPPYTDYYVCQQGIRRCFLEHGNQINFESPENCCSASYFM